MIANALLDTGLVPISRLIGLDRVGRSRTHRKEAFQNLVEHLIPSFADYLQLRELKVPCEVRRFDPAGEN
jgi:5-carboxymethyl-2-hydroxymuconate isomerase